MNKHLIYAMAATIFGLAAMVACNGNKSDKETAGTDTVQAVGTDKPYADSEACQTYSAKLGGQSFEITISRKADTSLPTVTDENGKQFYANRVDVDIKAEGKDFFHRSYTREAFEDFLNEEEKRGTVLLGMAYDSEKSDGHAIRLGAQIGQVGVEEGPAFSIEIPLDGSASSIVRDSNQDTTGDDGLSD